MCQCALISMNGPTFIPIRSYLLFLILYVSLLAEDLRLRDGFHDTSPDPLIDVQFSRPRKVSLYDLCALYSSHERRLICSQNNNKRYFIPQKHG